MDSPTHKRTHLNADVLEMKRESQIKFVCVSISSLFFFCWSSLSISKETKKGMFAQSFSNGVSISRIATEICVRFGWFPFYFSSKCKFKTFDNNFRQKLMENLRFSFHLLCRIWCAMEWEHDKFHAWQCLSHSVRFLPRSPNSKPPKSFRFVYFSWNKQYRKYCVAIPFCTDRFWTTATIEIIIIDLYTRSVCELSWSILFVFFSFT